LRFFVWVESSMRLALFRSLYFASLTCVSRFSLQFCFITLCHRLLRFPVLSSSKKQCAFRSVFWIKEASPHYRSVCSWLSLTCYRFVLAVSATVGLVMPEYCTRSGNHTVWTKTGIGVHLYPRQASLQEGTDTATKASKV
jgi:hypothetical protein